VLAKLFAGGEKTTDLHALLDESDVIILAEVEPVFRAAGQYSTLCKLYSKRGDDAALLTVWSKCATFLGLSPLLRLLIVSAKMQTCRRRMDRSRDPRPTLRYVFTAHGTARPCVDSTMGHLAGRKGRGTRTQGESCRAFPLFSSTSNL
jgi:hypothetical protein